jgi:hypothetical protein
MVRRFSAADFPITDPAPNGASAVIISRQTMANDLEIGDSG